MHPPNSLPWKGGACRYVRLSSCFDNVSISSSLPTAFSFHPVADLGVKFLGGVCLNFRLTQRGCFRNKLSCLKAIGPSILFSCPRNFNRVGCTSVCVDPNQTNGSSAFLRRRCVRAEPSAQRIFSVMQWGSHGPSLLGHLLQCFSSRPLTTHCFSINFNLWLILP